MSGAFRRSTWVAVSACALALGGCAEGWKASEAESRDWLPEAFPHLKRAIVLLRTCQPKRPSGYNNIWVNGSAPYGGVGTGPQAVGRTRDIRGPYEWRTVLKPGSSGVQGPHQGGYVETPSGEGWFLHFKQTGAFGRIDYLEPVRWENDWPIIGAPIPGDAEAGQPVARGRLPDTGNAATQDEPQESDEFAGRQLGVQWEWNHNPVDSAWSLSARPGWLRLTALPAQYLVTRATR